VGSVALAAVSVVLVAPGPDYDPWAWLVWGRELAGGGLSTVDGPAFKPLPVAVCAALSFFGSAAPWLWVLVARAGAVLAAILAFRLGRRLGPCGGPLAAVAVVACGGFLDGAAGGLSEGLLIAAALAGVEAWRGGRPGWIRWWPCVRIRVVPSAPHFSRGWGLGVRAGVSRAALRSARSEWSVRHPTRSSAGPRAWSGDGSAGMCTTQFASERSASTPPRTPSPQPLER